MNMNKNKNKNKDIKKPIEERLAMWIGTKASLYVHTVLFLLALILILLGVSEERVLLMLTTLVSLEAIYLAIFIQMSVNKNTESLEEVEEDLDEIQEDLDEIQEDVDEIQEDIDEIEEEVDEIEEGDNKRDKQVDSKFTKIDQQLAIILQEIKNLKK